MKIVEQNLEKRVQFWSLLGPFFILLIFFVSLVKVSHSNLILALVSMIAIPVCWKWKIYGLAGVIGTLAAVIAYHFNDLTLIDRFWEVGMGIAISIACTVTTLSFEEAENLVQNLQVQSDSRLSNIWHLDEKLKTLQETYQNEKQLLVDELEKSQSKIEKYQIDLATFEKLSRVSHEEVLVYQEKNNELLEELHASRAQVSRLEKAQQELDKQIAVIQKAEQEKLVLKKEIAQITQSSQHYQNQVQHLQISLKQLEDVQKEKEALLAQVEETQALELDSRLRQTEGKYRQLTRQFKEKSDVLDETRRELFFTQESYAALTREVEEQKVYGNDEEYDTLVKYLISVEKEHETNCHAYQVEIDELTQLIASIIEPPKEPKAKKTKESPTKRK